MVRCVGLIADSKSVIPACVKRWFDWAHHRWVQNYTPDKKIQGGRLLEKILITVL